MFQGGIVLEVLEVLGGEMPARGAPRGIFTHACVLSRAE